MTSDINTNAPVTPALPKKRRRKSVSLDKKKSRAGWLFVLPFVIGLIFIYLPVITNSIYMTFCTLSHTSTGYLLTFDPNNAFVNYKYALLEHDWFYEALVNTLTDLMLDIPSIVIFALFMALLLNQDMKGRAVFRAIFFVPVILSTGLIDEIDYGANVAESLREGIAMEDGTGDETNQFLNIMDISSMLQGMRVGGGIVEYAIDLVNNILDIVNKSGVQMLIFLSGLQSISPSIYESCSIEGASAWETFWKITLPMISPMILVNAVYTTIDSFTSSSNSVMKAIGMEYLKKDYQTHMAAMSWSYFLVVALFVVLVALILSAYTFYQRREN
ncbi:MAG: sugar ABC transporter permease [Clostridia bacterium]|nr:sugar ABC transporter permease [Clostridia bacterium]